MFAQLINLLLSRSFRILFSTKMIFPNCIRQLISGSTSAQIAAIIFAAFISAGVFAQSPNTATLTVTVVDANGAPVSGATVNLANPATGAVRNAISNADGSVYFTALPLTGTYSVTVSQSGF